MDEILKEYVDETKHDAPSELTDLEKWLIETLIEERELDKFLDAMRG